jgi:hypothetical protein
VMCDSQIAAVLPGGKIDSSKHSSRIANGSILLSPVTIRERADDLPDISVLA